ncbi:MAG: late competence development ComFB family protein [Sporomusaceae bacterium]|jgi:competence protein ComFB|nr:late competence development ComFB family protein [Sporomusaceae bacterium]
MGQPKYKLKNCMEDLVWQYMEQILHCYEGLCNCDRCRYDIFAIALNSLPARYVVSDLGETYTKIQMLDNEFRVSVMTAISLAVDIVKSHPRHDDKVS